MESFKVAIGFMVVMGVAVLGARATIFPRVPIDDESVSLSGTQSYVNCYEPTQFNRKLVAEISVTGGAVHGGFFDRADAEQISATIAIDRKSVQLAALQDSYFTNLVKGKTEASTTGGGEVCLVYAPMRVDRSGGSVTVNITMKAYWRP